MATVYDYTTLPLRVAFFFFFCCVYLCVCALLSIVFDFFRLRRLVELGQEAINAVSGLSPSGPGSFCLEWS